MLLIIFLLFKFKKKTSCFTKDCLTLGGDVVNDDGSGSISIYGETFDDENLDTQHTVAGFVSMANRGKLPHLTCRVILNFYSFNL